MTGVKVWVGNEQYTLRSKCDLINLISTLTSNELADAVLHFLDEREERAREDALEEANISRMKIEEALEHATQKLQNLINKYDLEE